MRWQWHSWTTCKSFAQITTPAPRHSIFTGRTLFLVPNNSVKALTMATSLELLSRQESETVGARNWKALRELTPPRGLKNPALSDDRSDDASRVHYSDVHIGRLTFPLWLHGGNMCKFGTLEARRKKLAWNKPVQIMGLFIFRQAYPCMTKDIK